MEAQSFLLGARERFDIALLDPPYGENLIPAVLPKLAGLMKDTGVIVCETEKNEELPEAAGEFLLHPDLPIRQGEDHDLQKTTGRGMTNGKTGDLPREL